MKKGILIGILGVAFATPSIADVGLICQLAPGADPIAIAARYKISFIDRTEGAPFAYFRVISAAEADRIQIRMATDPQLVWAEDDENITTPETERVRNVLQKGSTLPAVGDRFALYVANQNVLTQINWHPSAAGRAFRTVKVAILDTGLSPNQPYLWAKVYAAANFAEKGQAAHDLPRNQDTNGNRIFDEATGHGTMVAGIIDQIAPQSRFVIARVANSDGQATAWTLIKGLAFACVNGAEVANVSLGTLLRVPALSDVMDWVDTKGMIVVAAIGNNGQKASCFPAKISKVVCTVGLNPNNTKATFSNWESGCDVSAPATGIISQNWDGALGIWSGTSFSTPMAAGAIADALKNSTPMPVGLLRDLFKTSGRDLDRLNPKYKSNIGKLLDCTNYAAQLRNPRP